MDQAGKGAGMTHPADNACDRWAGDMPVDRYSFRAGWDAAVASMQSSKARPTLEQVKAYCKERKNHVDPQAWFDHYSSNGWRVGRNPMKDWQAAVRTWERNSGGAGQSSFQQQRTFREIPACN